MSLALPTPERRINRTPEIRAATVDGRVVLRGKAIVYNTRSENLGGFFEIIRPGAFTESLKTADVRALIDHIPSLILGRTSAGSLRLDDTAASLDCEIDLNTRVSYANDLAINIEDGKVNQMSFGFIASDDRWDVVDGVTIRTVIKAEIFDVSAVTFPAFVDTTIALRSLESARKSQLGDPDAMNRCRNMLKMNLRKLTR